MIFLGLFLIILVGGFFMMPGMDLAESECCTNCGKLIKRDAGSCSFCGIWKSKKAPIATEDQIEGMQSTYQKVWGFLLVITLSGAVIQFMFGLLKGLWNMIVSFDYNQVYNQVSSFEFSQADYVEVSRYLLSLESMMVYIVLIISLVVSFIFSRKNRWWIKFPILVAIVGCSLLLPKSSEIIKKEGFVSYDFTTSLWHVFDGGDPFGYLASTTNVTQTGSILLIALLIILITSKKKKRTQKDRAPSPLPMVEVPAYEEEPPHEEMPTSLKMPTSLLDIYPQFKQVVTESEVPMLVLKMMTLEEESKELYTLVHKDSGTKAFKRDFLLLVENSSPNNLRKWVIEVDRSYHKIMKALIFGYCTFHSKIEGKGTVVSNLGRLEAMDLCAYAYNSILEYYGEYGDSSIAKVHNAMWQHILNLSAENVAKVNILEDSERVEFIQGLMLEWLSLSKKTLQENP